MEIAGAWQWRPRATITAADSCAVCSVLALQLADCAVLRVRRSGRNWCTPTGSNDEPQVEDDDGETGIELHGHMDSVTSLRVYYDASLSFSSVIIASASRDCVMAWHADANGRVSQSVLVENPAVEPGCLAFDATGTMLAVAVGTTVNVLVVERGTLYATLEGHIARVTKCEFHPLYHHLLVTTSEDRTFKIWDLSAKELRFQSAVLSAFSILSLAMNPVTGDAAFGFSDGTIKVFMIAETGAFARELAVMDAAAYLRRSASQIQAQEKRGGIDTAANRLPEWARAGIDEPTVVTAKGGANKSLLTDQISSSNDNGRDLVEVATPILALRYLCVDADVLRTADNTSETTSSPSIQFNAHGEQNLLNHAQFLVAGLPSCAITINAYSFEMSTLHDFQNSLTSSSAILDQVCVAKEFCFHRSSRLLTRSCEMYCGILSAFQPCFTMIQVCTVPQRQTANNQLDELFRLNSCVNDPQSDSGIRLKCDDNNSYGDISSRTSVIPAVPPPKGSVLNLPPLSATSRTTPPKKSTLDKPITFRTRIKSSGYGGTINPTAAFGGKKRMVKDKRGSNRSSSQPSSSEAVIDAYLKEYPTSCGVLSSFQEKNALPPHTLHQSAILSLEFSHDAKMLATSGSDRVAQVCKLPFSRYGGEGNVFAGHDQAVRSIHWSYSNRMIATTSSDKTTRLWLVDSDTPSLTLEGAAPISSVATSAQAMVSGLSSLSPAICSAKKSVIKQDIVDSLFFYMDRFIVSACGNVLRLHQFELDEQYARASTTNNKIGNTKTIRSGVRNDIDIPENRSRKKRVAQWAFNEMQTITSIACVNGSILSPVVVVGGSDRSLRVVDTGVGKTVRIISDAHSRKAIHSLALPRASCFTSHPSNFYDLLASAAANNTVHLWDVRADNCVMRFGEHVNRVHSLGVAFSPCMRYVATGSEDRSAYLYDLRTGRCITKLNGHTDVVTSVAFNPLHPQLATASYDGTVRFYSDSSVMSR